MSMEVLEPEPMRIRKTTLAQQMAEKAYDATKVNTEATVPRSFKRHWRTFSEEEARQLPPHREYDHRIELRPDAPNIINSKVYPLSRDEQRSSTSTSRIISTKAIFVHRRPDTDPQHSRQKEGWLSQNCT